MRRGIIKYLIISVTVACLLSACGEEEVIEELPEIPLHTITNSYTWQGLEITPITPVSASEYSGETLEIFPYYNSNEYIKMEMIITSDNHFWDSVIKEYKDTDNYKKTDNYSYLTTPQGTTIGYVDAGDNAIIVSSDMLPSSYVEKVLDNLCQALFAT